MSNPALQKSASLTKSLSQSFSNIKTTKLSLSPADASRSRTSSWSSSGSKSSRASAQSHCCGDDDHKLDELVRGSMQGGKAKRRQAVRSDKTRPGFHEVGDARKASICIRCCRRIADNRVFLLVTTLLTLYALVGDDLRILFTNKPADDFFNVVTLVCLFVFTFEIIISCFGKNDYLFGFFMALDVVSTITLILDLSWVTEIVLGDGDNLDNMRSGRTARVGAKAGRVVRVIRLVRILKLYKAVYESAHRRKESALEKEWEGIETAQEADESDVQESRVGKKLSEMTTRRVIILVLTMLLALPFLRASDSSNVPASAYYGADDIYVAWLERVNKPSWAEGQKRYEQSVLRYLYYHNWFTARGAEYGASCPSDSGFDYACSSWYYSHVFWVGITSKDENTIIDKLNTTQLSASSVQDFNKRAANQDDIYNFGTMPEGVLPIMSGQWSSACSDQRKGIFRRGFSLLEHEIDGKVDYAAPCPSDLRATERTVFYPRLLKSELFKKWHFAFYFDTRFFVKQEALFGIIITGFVCLVLCVASLSFSNDANRLVLQPVEHMIKRVESIRENPLIAMRMADEEFKIEEKQKANMANRSSAQRFKAQVKMACHCGSTVAREPLETVILEKTIIKLGSLLALGFGEAGANIIGHNLESSDSAGVNVMIPGTKVECIVGKAQINDFSTATEVFQARVMTFVNQIAEIVHGVVGEFWGAANKNNGDTFLLIWRTSGLDEPTRTKYADMSMLAFARILSAVYRSSVLAAYRAHPRLQSMLGKNCRVWLSFGLHAGWAIEGAVGSEFKIDASYLSPNVSIAYEIELATKIYDVPILISKSVIMLASEGVSSKCRLIDRVTIKGSTQPMDLYSLDLDYGALTVEQPRDPKMQWNVRVRFKVRQFLEVEKNRRMQSDVHMGFEFEANKEFCLMRRRYTTSFLQLFHMGFQNYTNGEWEVARRLLSEARTMLRGTYDGPSTALLRFMEHPYDFQAPDGWEGIREL